VIIGLQKNQKKKGFGRGLEGVKWRNEGVGRDGRLFSQFQSNRKK